MCNNSDDRFGFERKNEELKKVVEQILNIVMDSRKKTAKIFESKRNPHPIALNLAVGIMDSSTKVLSVLREQLQNAYKAIDDIYQEWQRQEHS